MPASHRPSQGGEQPTMLSTQQTQQKQNGNSHSDNGNLHEGFFLNTWTGQHSSYRGPGVPPNHECILQHFGHISQFCFVGRATSPNSSHPPTRISIHTSFRFHFIIQDFLLNCNI